MCILSLLTCCASGRVFPIAGEQQCSQGLSSLLVGCGLVLRLRRFRPLSLLPCPRWRLLWGAQRWGCPPKLVYAYGGWDSPERFLIIKKTGPFHICYTLHDTDIKKNNLAYNEMRNKIVQSLTEPLLMGIHDRSSDLPAHQRVHGCPLFLEASGNFGCPWRPRSPQSEAPEVQHEKFLRVTRGKQKQWRD